MGGDTYIEVAVSLRSDVAAHDFVRQAWLKSLSSFLLLMLNLSLFVSTGYLRTLEVKESGPRGQNPHQLIPLIIIIDHHHHQY